MSETPLTMLSKIVIVIVLLVVSCQIWWSACWYIRTIISLRSCDCLNFVRVMLVKSSKAQPTIWVLKISQTINLKTKICERV